MPILITNDRDDDDFLSITNDSLQAFSTPTGIVHLRTLFASEGKDCLIKDLPAMRCLYVMISKAKELNEDIILHTNIPLLDQDKDGYEELSWYWIVYNDLKKENYRTLFIFGLLLTLWEKGIEKTNINTSYTMASINQHDFDQADSSLYKLDNDLVTSIRDIQDEQYELTLMIEKIKHILQQYEEKVEEIGSGNPSYDTIDMTPLYNYERELSRRKAHGVPNPEEHPSVKALFPAVEKARQEKIELDLLYQEWVNSRPIFELDDMYARWVWLNDRARQYALASGSYWQNFPLPDFGLGETKTPEEWI